MVSEHIHIDLAEPITVERFDEAVLTGRGRALALLQRILSRIAAVVGLAALFTPLLLSAVVTLDLPLGFFDRIHGPSGMLPSAFLSRGEGTFVLATLGMLLATRVVGAETSSRAVLVAWLMLGVCLLMIVADLSPQLEPEDFPDRRFIGFLLGSWLAGQYLATWAYQLTRGGAWWRAPFFGAAVGFVVQAAIYFPGAYAGTGLPWRHWMALDLIIGLTVAGVFVLFYGPLRLILRPQSGLGGR
ncbi:MAG: hypothetical protein AAGH41_13635 [Pseudomonadota bacterium]